MSEIQAAWVKATRDFEDFQLELAGAGLKISRFLGEGDVRSPEGREKKRVRETARSRLAELLLDPVYAAKYDLAWERLRDAEAAVADSFRVLDQRLSQVDASIAEMEDHAARLPDGELVFRDQDGVVRRKDGSVVDDDLAATILWTGSEPSFEAYSAAIAEREMLEQSREGVRRFENDILGPARDRLEDEDSPPSLSDLDDILAQLDKAMPDLSTLAPAPLDTAPVASVGFDVTSVGLPDLGGKP